MTIIHLKNVPVPERCLTKQNPDLSEVIRLHWLQGDDDVCGCIFDGIYVPYFLSRARRVTVSDSVFVFVLCSCRVFRELIDSLSLLILTSENHIFFFSKNTFARLTSIVSCIVLMTEVTLPHPIQRVVALLMNLQNPTFLTDTIGTDRTLFRFARAATVPSTLSTKLQHF